jgi:hypothetical protein
MESLLTSAQSPSWWVGVVGVGVAINLFSAWLGPWLAKRTGALARRLGAASNRYASRYRADVSRIRASSAYARHVAMREMRCRHQATLYLLSGGFGMVAISLQRGLFVKNGLFPSVTFLIVVLVYLGLHSYAKATLLESQLNSAEEPPFEG